jgi:hypothetical protein
MVVGNMSIVIRISKVNWDRLKRFAVPLEDSVDDALGRVLDIAEAQAQRDRPMTHRHDYNENRASIQECSGPETSRAKNDNPLLEKFEHWLFTEPHVKLLHAKKTMNTYVLETALEAGKKRPKLFVPTNGMSRLYLPRVDYTPIDSDHKVIYKDYRDSEGRITGWNYYPQLVVSTEADLEFAKELVLFVINNFQTT